MSAKTTLKIAYPSFVIRSYTLQVAGSQAEVDELKKMLKALPEYSSVIAVDDKRHKTGFLNVTIRADSATEARTYLEEKFKKVTPDD